MSEFSKIYFIGIGGIGMSALARYFKFKGKAVGGYDRTPSTLTEALQAEGIEVHYDDNPDRIPTDKASTLVVYTPAVPDSLRELQYVREKGYPLLKRSRALGDIAAGQTCLAVAGTHGKTTTSTLLAHIMTEAGGGCTAFLGGISKNYNSNLLTSHKNVIVAEADEYDRSFLQLSPSIAVITAMDPDHLDIYGTEEEYRKAFGEFAAKVSKTLIIKKGLDLSQSGSKAAVKTYSLSGENADFQALGAKADSSGHFVYDLAWPGGLLRDIRVGTPGWVNAENSVAAAAAALSQGLKPEAVRMAISSFKGVRRRLDERFNSPRAAYIDDYAHHPQELQAAISSIREIFPGRKLTGIFQPHLYTRTRDFAPEFAAALSKLDRLVLLDIYPAREEPIEGVDSTLILRQASLPDKRLLRKEELLEWIDNEDIDVLATFGAGDIDRLVQPIEALMKRKYAPAQSS